MLNFIRVDNCRINKNIAAMKLNAEYMKAALQAIMDVEGMSPEEIANAAGLNRTAIYKILNGNTSAVRRSTIRQIADGLNYNFVIEGDRVTFVKRPEKVNGGRPDLKELLDKYERMTPEGREQLLKIAGVLCGDGALTEQKTHN